MTWKNEKKSKALLVVFGIYLALLAWCILFKFALRPEEIPHLRGINLIPYAASVVVNGKVQISEIIENMLVFLPFGLCISAIYPDSEIQNRILLASGLSLFFEVTQYIFASGASDITDVIDNTLGAVIGILLYLGMKKIWKEKTGKIITILGAVLEVLFLALLFFSFAANKMRRFIASSACRPESISFAIGARCSSSLMSITGCFLLQKAFQFFSRSGKAAGNRPFRQTQHLRNLRYAQSLIIVQQDRFTELPRQLVNGAHQLGLFLALLERLFLRRNDIQRRRAEHHALEPCAAPQIAAAIYRHAKKPRFFAAGGNRLAARIELDEHILTDVFGLLFIRQIKIRHAQHVVRVLRIQLFELSLTIRRFHAAFQPFHFLPSDIKTNEPVVFIR